MSPSDMASDRPCIRASNAKAQLKFIRALPEPQRAAALARIPPHVIEAIDALPSTGWLPVADNATLVHAAHAVMSPEAFEDLYRRLSLHSLEHPLMRGALSFILRVAKVTPRTLVRNMPAGWSLTWKNCGKLAIEDTSQPNEARLVWTAVPLELLHDPVVLKTFRPAFAAVLSFVNAQPAVEHQVDPLNRTIVFTIRW